MRANCVVASKVRLTILAGWCRKKGRRDSKSRSLFLVDFGRSGVIEDCSRSGVDVEGGVVLEVI